MATTRNSNIENLSLDLAPILLKQVHGSKVILADDIKPGEIIQADGLYTQAVNKICGIKTADCLPLLLCDKKGSCVAAIHAGWRGLASGIIEAAIEKLPVKPENLLAWMGPAIGSLVFEVGEDVRERFPEDHLAFRVISEKLPEKKYLCDIYLLARRRLESYGVIDIYGGTECTYSNREKFYSYRQGDTGRLLSLIWITL
jgi:YfiH family protein